jgi:hypothetical protein
MDREITTSKTYFHLQFYLNQIAKINDIKDTVIHCLSCDFLSNLNWISKLSTSVLPNISSSDQVQLKKQL